MCKTCLGFIFEQHKKAVPLRTAFFMLLFKENTWKNSDYYLLIFKSRWDLMAAMKPSVVR